MAHLAWSTGLSGCSGIRFTTNARAGSRNRSINFGTITMPLRRSFCLYAISFCVGPLVFEAVFRVGAFGRYGGVALSSVSAQWYSMARRDAKRIWEILYRRHHHLGTFIYRWDQVAEAYCGRTRSKDKLKESHGTFLK